MIKLVLIFVGAGFGGVCRYLAGQGVHGLLGLAFPYGTLLVNVSGSFLMGLAFVFLVAESRGLSAGLWPFLMMTGFLGGFTTFSAFSLDSFHLFEQQAYGSWFVYIAGSVVFSLVGLWLGIMLARSL
jgi:CrcB protein